MIRDILIQHGGQPHIGIKDSPGEDLALATLQGTVLRRPNWVCVWGGVLYSGYRDGGTEEMGLGNGKEGLFAYPPRHHNSVSPADSFNKSALGLQERLAIDPGSVPSWICSTTHSKAMILPGETCERLKGSAAVKCPTLGALPVGSLSRQDT